MWPISSLKPTDPNRADISDRFSRNQKMTDQELLFFGHARSCGHNLTFRLEPSQLLQARRPRPPEKLSSAPAGFRLRFYLCRTTNERNKRDPNEAPSWNNGEDGYSASRLLGPQFCPMKTDLTSRMTLHQITFTNSKCFLFHTKLTLYPG